ncbi:hypothetical protein [Paenibacillus harenae]|uniref:hypothetical protein n=1 Tax=Paenibacillus harenae TaxID=306543 RepID=UPI00278D0237|nr:hypothetical protein [Paenibacillus harenae]MDQ0059991.1 hypothetical protein [Paenibacillus harenae]
MIEQRRHIRIDSEDFVEDIENSQVDVVVIFPDSTTWISNFYTIKCIESMRSDYLKNGRCLNGAYWCASSPVIIVDNVSRERIEQVVDELIENKTFEYLFEYFGPVQERDLTRTRFKDDFFNTESKIEPSIVYRQATQLKQMLDQASDEVKTIIMKEVFGVSP